MANVGSIKAGRAFVEIGADQSALEKGLRAASAKTKAFGQSIASIGAVVSGVGAAIVAPFITGVKGAMELEDSMAAAGVIFGDSADIIIKKSEEMASSGRAVQGEFLNAANSFGAVFKGAGSSQKDAADLGNQLAELGIDMASFGSGVSQAEAFTALQAALRGEFDPLERFTVFLSAAKVEAEALGSGLASSKDDLTDYAKKQATLNLIMKGTKDQQGDQVRSIDSLKGIWTVFTNTLSNASVVIGQSIAPLLKTLGKALMPVIQGTVGWLKANQGLLLTIFTVGAGIAAIGATLVVIGAAIYGAGVAFGLMATAVSTFGAVFGAVFGAILSPIGLVVAAIAGTTAAFLMFTETGQSTLAWLGGAFEGLKADATAAFAGIGDALKSGDITLAAQILWAFLKVEFQKGINFLNGIWQDWGLAVRQVFSDVSFWLAGQMIETVAGMKRLWVDLTGFMRDAFSVLVGWISKAWNNLGGFFAKTWERIKALFSGEDIQAKIEAIDKQTASANAAQDQVTTDQVGGRLDPRKEALDKIKAEEQAQQQALKDQQQAETEARRKAAADSLKAGEADLQAAKDELASLTGQAMDDALNEEAAAFTSKDAATPTVTPELNPEGLDRAIGQTKSKVDVAGSFSASALAGLGVGSTIENEQLDESKKHTKELEKLNKKKAVFT